MMRAAVLMGPNRGRHMSCWSLVAALVLSARVALAVDVGQLVDPVGRVEVKRGDALIPAKTGTLIAVGDELITYSPGKTDLNLGPDVAARLFLEESLVIVSALSIYDNSRAEIDAVDVVDPHEPKVRLVLKDGKALVRVIKVPENGTYEIVTPAGKAIARGTAFVVKHTAADGVTEVVGARGTVQAVGQTGPERTVSPHWRTRIKRGEAAEPPVQLSEQQFRQYIEGLEFIGGGRPESLTVADPLRKGTKVPQPYRFALGVGPPPDTLEPCVHTSAPTCIPPEPVGGLGNLDIEF